MIKLLREIRDYYIIDKFNKCKKDDAKLDMIIEIANKRKSAHLWVYEDDGEVSIGLYRAGLLNELKVTLYTKSSLGIPVTYEKEE